MKPSLSLLPVVALSVLAGCTNRSGSAAATAGHVIISEVMYHPVLEEDAVERHEFVELHNPTDAEVALGGWRLAGDVTFTFRAGTTLRPGGHLAVAKDRAALLAVYGAGGRVVGDYEGALDNGRGDVRLLDDAGRTVERVTYDDEFPWPIAADALGAGERWLRAEELPLEDHRHKGRSLVRTDARLPANDPASWDVSALDQPSPGRANAATRALPIVARLDASGPAPEGIRPGDSVNVVVGFAGPGEVRQAEVEYFVDDLDRDDEKMVRAPLARAGATWRASLPGQPEGALVRYRVRADRSAGWERLSPRPTDPQDWHAYFVEAPVASDAPVYHILVGRREWGRMWDNLQDGPVVGCRETPKADDPATHCGPDRCQVNPRWDAFVPAVFVHQGKVTDVRARYQGSRTHRLRGPMIAEWAAPPLSDAPMDPFRALSWNIKFPRYREFGGKDTVVLNKMRPHPCYGYDSAFGARLYASVGIPAPMKPRYVRVHVNGAYYHYMQEWEHTAASLMKASFPDEPLGDYFESAGYMQDEGPKGFGDERLLEPHCGFDARARYQATYDKKTNEWRGHDDLIALIAALHEARAAGTEATRAFFAQHFDVERLTTYMAVRNWSAAWDDIVHNHVLYRRADGKWLIFPWDVEQEFGGSPNKANATFYMGSEQDPGKGVAHWQTNKVMWSYLKDAFLVHMRAEFNARLRALAENEMSAERVAAVAAEALTDFSLPDMTSAPAWSYMDAAGKTPNRCDIAQRAEAVKKFAVDRNAHMKTALRD